MDKDEKINEILEELIRDNSVEYKNHLTYIESIGIKKQ